MRALFYTKVLLILTVAVPSIIPCQELHHPVKTRRKRFLIFPKGTVIQLVYCYLMSALGSDGVFTVGVTLGTNWDVPVDLDKLMYDQNMNIKANRRDRRSLYPRIEFVLNKLGLNGERCIRKLLCQVQNQQPSSFQRYSFIEEIIHEIFRYPNSPAFFEPMDKYDDILGNCEEVQFVSCS